jgi:hypothetical protein
LQFADTQYHLLDKARRFPPFTSRKIPDNTAMFAYRIVRHDPPFAPPLCQYDTVEVAVTPAQADRLVALTKTYFGTVNLPAVDSLSHRLPDGETADVSGRILLEEVRGRQVTAPVQAVHASKVEQQRAAFFRVEEQFAQLFDELPAN